MQLDEAKTDQGASFICFVYPFVFDSQKFDSLSGAIACAKVPQKQQLIWEPSTFPTEEVLFHVSRYLNPTDGSTPTAVVWRLSDAVRDRFGLRARWQLISPQGEIEFRFGSRGEDGQGQNHSTVKLILFRVGVGFLTLQIQPTTNHLRDWLNFLHYFRFLEGQRGTRVAAQRRVGKDEWENYFPEMAGGFASQSTYKFGDMVREFLHTVSPEIWWREIFVRGQMLPFASLYVDDLLPEKTPQLLYKLQNFFHSEQGENPAPEDLDPQHQDWLPYAQGQWFVFALEGGSFLAVNSSTEQFFRETLPQHLRQEYFLLFLLTLHQRFALMSILEQVADSWVTDEETRLQQFEQIRDRLLWFTARGYFAQVMQRAHHHRCYCQWQQVFQLKQLYQEVNDEVREMQEYLTLQYLRRLEAAEKESERRRNEEREQRAAAEKENERRRNEEKEQRAAAEKEREQERLEDLRRQEARERERDRLYMLALREREEAEKERERQYLQQLRAKDEAQAKRDRELQDLAYTVSAGLGGAAIFASTSGLLTAGSNDGRITVGWIPEQFRSTHPVTIAICLSLLATVGFAGGAWGLRWGGRWRKTRQARRKLEAFLLLLGQYPAEFSWRDREHLAELANSQPHETRELSEALWSWCQSKPHLLTRLAFLEKQAKISREPDYQHRLIAAIAPPTAARKKIEAFLQLLQNHRHLFDVEAQNHLAQQQWSGEPETLAEQINKWCQVEQHSEIYTRFLEERQNLPEDLPISESGDCSQRLRQAIRQLNPPPPPSLV